jgi:hypothetical protein
MAVVFRHPDGKVFKGSDLEHILKLHTVKGFSLGNVFLTALFAALSHIFIDIRFEPYGFAYYPVNVKVSLSVGYGVIMGMGIFFGHKLIPGRKLFWHVWKELVFWIILIFSITSVNFVFRYFLLNNVYNIYDIYSISYVRFLLVGVEVVGTTALLLKFFQTMLIKSNMIKVVVDQSAAPDETPPTENNPDNDTPYYHITINGRNKNEQLTLPLSSIVYLHSSGNYVQVFYENGSANEGFKKVLIRQSLSDVEKQLSNEDSIVRVHKSFLVNKNRIKGVNGNSKKAMLVLDHDIELPLRRDLYNTYK